MLVNRKSSISCKLPLWPRYVQELLRHQTGLKGGSNLAKYSGTRPFKDFKANINTLKMNYKTPVEGGGNGNVLPLLLSHLKTSSHIVDRLETSSWRLTDSIIKCVTVFQPRHDEGVDYSLEVLVWPSVCLLPDSRPAKTYYWNAKL